MKKSLFCCVLVLFILGAYGMVFAHYGMIIPSDSMVMQGERFVRGKKTIDRITWTPDSDDSVRQHWQQSTDRGQTWVSVFDGRYTRVDE